MFADGGSYSSGTDPEINQGALLQGYVFPRDMCFPGMRVSRTQFPRDACFPTHISLKQQLATSHSDMCVPGKCVSPEISLHFTSSPQFEP